MFFEDTYLFFWTGRHQFRNMNKTFSVDNFEFTILKVNRYINIYLLLISIYDYIHTIIYIYVYASPRGGYHIYIYIHIHLADWLYIGRLNGPCAPQAGREKGRSRSSPWWTVRWPRGQRTLEPLGFLVRRGDVGNPYGGGPWCHLEHDLQIQGKPNWLANVGV